MEIHRRNITPCLWFANEAEAAVELYTSIFRNSRVGRVTRYGKEGFEVHGEPEGTVMTVEFEIDGQPFMALNGGPGFRFTEAVSFAVRCESQAEIDYYWQGLSEGGDGRAQVCGWLKDRYGLSWQVVPSRLADYLADPDPGKSGRVMKALLKMKKIDLDALTRAYEGRG